MGIVIKQSVSNTLITFLGFVIGALNALYLYTQFLGKDFYGLTAFVLSTANIVMPLMAFGVQNTLVKFYPTFKTEVDKSQFLNLMLLLPLLVSALFFVLFWLGYDLIASQISKENPEIYQYAFLVPLVAFFMAYFELFYAWVKVHLKSIFGNFLKEVLLRVFVSIALLAVFKGWITKIQFVYVLVFLYLIVTVLMALVAFSIRKPDFSVGILAHKKPYLVFSTYIIFSSSIAVLLLDIDKFMIAQYIPLDQIAYYSVAVFMALTISVPMRAMHQITHPITTQLMVKNKLKDLQDLYQKTSITLQISGGLIMVCILANVDAIYKLVPPEYAGGIWVVFIISISKYFDLMLGNNNSIVFNSKYYQTVLFLGLCLVGVTVIFNMLFIPRFGIEGAALATLLSIGIYSLAKLFFVVKKMHLFPFTMQTLVSLGICLGTFFTVYFINFSWYPILLILFKSSCAVLLYVGLHYYLKVSSDINTIIDKFVVLFKIKKAQ
jgi:O-antigen/teichoic acid export membrane protein